MDKLRRKIVAAMELPKDITLDLPVLVLTGDEEALVRNHKGLLEYGAGFVRLKTSIGAVKIFGTDLMLKEITTESVFVAGKIDKVTWEG